MMLLANYRKCLILKGDVYIDELYYKLIKSDIPEKKGKEKHGLSHNQFCIGIGCDENNIYCQIEKMGKPSTDSTMITFIDHIKKRSKLIHDAEKSHNGLVQELKLQSTVYHSKDLKGIPDEDNPLDPINKACNRVKSFLNSHKGFNRDHLQGLIDLYVFIYNTPIDNLEKIDFLIKYALDEKTLHRYRNKPSFLSSN